ncbi:hypothetical protein GH714_025723 [Hevea brasiliensis]|uniref:Uncharacterized protein n=1 Tax=Hevea brasiliensis TaxID=3981 RepID=A0A6A6MQ29_HEVBR|nr:hypothetical protein GH714_025723 [Hevea brasiliensis]
MTIEEAAGPAGPKVLRLLYFVGAGCELWIIDHGKLQRPSAGPRQHHEEDCDHQIINRKLLEGDFGKEIGDFDEKGGLKVVMIVLKKVELEWADVSIDEGKKLQDVLEEIERERES